MFKSLLPNRRQPTAPNSVRITRPQPRMRWYS
jgi:hypothetical protein